MTDYTISDEIKEYKVRYGNRVIEDTGEPISFQGYEEYEFFVYLNLMGNYTITEKTTGRAISGEYRTKNAAVKNAIKQLNNHGKKLFEHVRQEGIDKWGEL